MSRIAREKWTIEAMIRIYCAGRHRAEGKPCPECVELLDYALVRLDRISRIGDHLGEIPIPERRKRQ